MLVSNIQYTIMYIVSDMSSCTCCMICTVLHYQKLSSSLCLYQKISDLDLHSEIQFYYFELMQFCFVSVSSSRVGNLYTMGCEGVRHRKF